MKGVIFREFLDFAEANMGEELVETAIDNVSDQLASGGAYTSVGTYDHTEVLVLLTEMCRLAEADAGPIVESFGYHLFGALSSSHSQMVEHYKTPFEFLHALDGIIHKEVKKLYPEAELPRIFIDDSDDSNMTIRYESTRPFSGVAFGLLKGCFNHYNQEVEIEKIDLDAKDGTKAQFNIKMLEAA